MYNTTKAQQLREEKEAELKKRFKFIGLGRVIKLGF